MPKNHYEPAMLSVSDGPAVFREVIEGRLPFRADGLHTGPAPMDQKGCGHLPTWWQEGIIGAKYVIYSGDTPIAWTGPEPGWVIPDEVYSETTSMHQQLIRDALGRPVSDNDRLWIRRRGRRWLPSRACGRGQHQEEIADPHRVTLLAGRRVEPGTRYCRRCLAILGNSRPAP